MPPRAKELCFENLSGSRPFSEPKPANASDLFGIVKPLLNLNSRVASQAVAAGAITEQCFENLRGAVYWLEKGWVTKTTVRAQEFVLIPDLVYVPREWTVEERAEWAGLSPKAYLQRLHAPSQLNPGALVMPIVLQFASFPNRSKTAPVDRLIEIPSCFDGKPGTGTMVALCIPHNAYLGWIIDMIPATEDEEPGLESLSDGTEKQSYWRVQGDRKNSAKMADWSALVNRLHQMYQEERPGSVVFFSTVFEWFLQGLEARDEALQGKAKSLPKNLRDLASHNTHTAEEAEQID